MESGLTGRVALISGGSRGIGKAVAGAFAAEGVSVALAARTVADLEATASSIRAKYSVQVLPVVADMARPEDVKRFIATAMAQLGRIDVLVNVAENAPAGRLD